MGRQQRRRSERRRAQRQAAKQPAPPQRRTGLYLVVAAVLLVIGAIGIAAASGTFNSASPTPTLAPESLAPAVDGIQCNTNEQVVYHIHQHLALFDHGKPVPLPSSIGIPGTEANPTCFYWIHVHKLYPDIIHVESPTTRVYTLGQFFDMWKATKNDAIPPGDAFVIKLQQAAASGNLTVYVERKRWTRSFRLITLTSHESITIEIGKPTVPPVIFTNWGQL
jgi:hypothetical protein